MAMNNESTTRGVQPYRIIPQSIPQDKRAEVNEKILFGIDTDNSAITPEAVYNCYTGIGGLHTVLHPAHGLPRYGGAIGADVGGHGARYVLWNG